MPAAVRAGLKTAWSIGKAGVRRHETKCRPSCVIRSIDVVRIACYYCTPYVVDCLRLPDRGLGRRFGAAHSGGANDRLPDAGHRTGFASALGSRARKSARGRNFPEGLLCGAANAVLGAAGDSFQRVHERSPAIAVRQDAPATPKGRAARQRFDSLSSSFTKSSWCGRNRNEMVFSALALSKRPCSI